MLEDLLTLLLNLEHNAPQDGTALLEVVVLLSVEQLDLLLLTQVLNALLVHIVMVLVMQLLLNVMHALMDLPVKALLFYMLILLHAQLLSSALKA